MSLIKRVFTLTVNARSELEMEAKLCVLKNDIEFLNGLYRNGKVKMDCKNSKIKEGGN